LNTELLSRMADHGFFMVRHAPEPAPTHTPRYEIGFVSQKPASHSPCWRLRDSPEIGFVSSTPKPLPQRHLPSQIGFVWEIATSLAQLAPFRTPCGTDLPFCPRPARRPVPLGAASPSSNWLRFAQGPHLTCHLLYLGLKLIRDARILLTSTVRIGYIHAGRASNYPAGLNE
jgi:hypothetical protein